MDPYVFALAHLGLGERDQTLAQLERAAERHSACSSVGQMTDARLDTLRSDPRFRQISGRMGVQPSS